ncbi:MAG: amylo-alpha-1,6-glucosidase [Candidatus Woesearchaeota archaeon]
MRKVKLLFQEGYVQALKVLQSNITPLGFSASTERHVNYFSVWARDHSITTLAALLTDDEQLIHASKKGILLLLQKQNETGQVPSYVEIEKKQTVYGGLGTITSIDSNMWVVIAAAQIYQKTKDKRFISERQIVRYKKIYRLLRGCDANNCGLIEVHQASDWADIFNRSYHVLYDECLYYLALESISYLYSEHLKVYPECENKEKKIKRIRWMTNRYKKIPTILNKNFWLTKDNIARIKDQYMIYSELRGDSPFYQSHIIPFKLEWENRFDSFANLLCILSGIATKKRSHAIIDFVKNHQVHKPFPLRALYPPVTEQDLDWEPIYYHKEQVNHYHNGGIWPMIAGFWIASLVKLNKQQFALQEFEQLAQTLKNQGWLFNEYMHGQTSHPLGRDNQAWSAAGYVMAYHALFENHIPFTLEKK